VRVWPGPNRYLLTHNKSVLVFTKSSGLNTMWLRPRAASPALGAGSDGAWETARLRRDRYQSGGVFDSNDFRKVRGGALLYHRRSHDGGKKTETRRCRHKANSLYSPPSAGLGLWASMRQRHFPYSARPGRQLEPLCRPWRTIRSLFAMLGANSSRTPAPRACRQPTSLSTIRNFRAGRSLFSRQLQRRMVFAEGLPKRPARSSHVDTKGMTGEPISARPIQ